jgi:uncharacterized membrane protein YcaP (DUF421 family)
LRDELAFEARMPEMFTFTMNPLELLLRGSIMYVGLILVMRFLLRRDIGSLSTPDLLFIVLIADAAQNAMAGEYKSLADGAVLVGTLVAWNIALDWLAFRSPAMRRLLTPDSLPLIINGKLLRQNLKKEWITREELESRLREAGIADVGQVERAVLESSGELGIIRRDEKPAHTRRKKPLA